MNSSGDTVYALSSARGRAGVAVVRLSGPQADAALARLTDDAPPPPLREARLRRLRDPGTGAALDDALVLRFAPGASFTGEAVVEIHCHGGPAIVAALLDALGALPGLRAAAPGEFTRRAFDRGRLDLAQIEGLADLIAADTEAQRRAALRQYDGALGREVRAWSRQLTESLALLEATIDFADEEIPDGTHARAARGALAVRAAIDAARRDSVSAERLRVGWRVALIGAPNAGKSTLVNALSRRDVAIVSEIAGTTRDALEIHLDLDGYPVTLIDTAGLRATEDAIERIGVDRARAQADSADLRIALLAADAPLGADAEAALTPNDLRVWNKADRDPTPPPGCDLAISAQAERGLAALIGAIRERLAFTDPAEGAVLLRARHREALDAAAGALDGFATLAHAPDSPLQHSPELAAEQLRLARNALGAITGEAGVERLLDVIFGEFCLGK